jgi:hypothetical protein
MLEKECINCKKMFTNRWQSKYCSNKCQFEFQYNEYIRKWKLGNQNGNRIRNTVNISKHLKKYLIQKHKEACSVCGWNKKHPKSGAVPLEVDHIDGDSQNNIEKNLRLLCPNCHALTPTFKNRNRGRGRKIRKKYL